MILSLRVVDAVVVRLGLGVGRRQTFQQLLGQVADANPLLSAEHERALNGVLELANVAG
jgi:hypothetical protein